MKQLLPFTIAPLLFVSCANNHSGRVLSDTLAGAGGAVLGNKLSDGKAGWTAAGVGAGVLVSEGIQHLGKQKAKAAYSEGYDKGRSDAVKQQYWLMVDAQKDTSRDGDFSFYEIPIPEQTINGATLLPTRQTLRIYE